MEGAWRGYGLLHPGQTPARRYLDDYVALRGMGTPHEEAIASVAATYGVSEDWVVRIVKRSPKLFEE